MIADMLASYLYPHFTFYLYAMTWLGRRAELGPFAVPVGCRAYKPRAASEIYGRAWHYKQTVQGPQ